MSDPLFQPIRVGGLHLTNRIVMPAMHLHMARDGDVTDRLLAFYAERARGGAGLVTVGYATVDDRAGTPAHLGAHRDAFVPGLAQLAATIHAGGARAAVQLNHAGRYAHSSHLRGGGPVAPSAIASRLTGETPHALDEEEIAGVLAAFGAAARRVKEAGFDAVEVLCGTGYLVSEFLSPLTNRRTDAWGGSFEGRSRFGLEVVRAVRAAVGPAFPVLARVNGLEGMPGGTPQAELLEFAARLVAEGVDMLGVNVGWHESRLPQLTGEVPRGGFAHLARAVKERVAVPVAASHRINDPGVARALVGGGACDLVAMGRALIADPFLPEKARSGREADVVHCVACGQGCFDRVLAMRPVECLANPVAGHEEERAPRRAKAPLRVLVAGGGAAGMSAAIAAADRGHEVVLYEEGDRLGGQLHLAGAPPGRGEFAVLARDLARQVALRGVRVVLRRAVDDRVLRQEGPGALVIATGGLPLAPPIPGADLPHVVQAWEVLAGRAQAGARTVVVGGGAAGVETALFLAAQDAARRVTVVEQAADLGRNLGRTTRWTMLADLERRGVEVRTDARVLAIDAASVRIEVRGREERLAAQTVVLAAGTRSLDTLRVVAYGRGVPFRVAGDAARVGTALEAIHQGFDAGAAVVLSSAAHDP
ncbi:MAG TPA: FAD-dependent oxidoreductase [Anaeromyxobacteraceae bacterium]|nr:FAD-dependent oxidoreductase [Anaeromyxobacteraceae bacterium]